MQVSFLGYNHPPSRRAMDVGPGVSVEIKSCPRYGRTRHDQGTLRPEEYLDRLIGSSTMNSSFSWDYVRWGSIVTLPWEIWGKLNWYVIRHAPLPRCLGYTAPREYGRYDNYWYLKGVGSWSNSQMPEQNRHSRRRYRMSGSLSLAPINVRSTG